MAHCIRHERCPECTKLGKDRSGNNFAIYSDGSKYCFSCHYLISSTGIARFKEAARGRDGTSGNAIVLPRDVDDTLPQKCWDYLANFALTEHDVKRNIILWSEYYQRLIFPYFNDTGLLAWQGRYLGEEANKAKWFSQGKLHEFIHVVGNSNSRCVVLVEDTISAIKVAHNPAVCAVPLFGSHVSTTRMLQLKLLYDIMIVWLDRDKAIDSIKYSKKLNELGIKSRSIITELDPKCYSDGELLRLTSHD